MGSEIVDTWTALQDSGIPQLTPIVKWGVAYDQLMMNMFQTGSGLTCWWIWKWTATALQSSSWSGLKDSSEENPSGQSFKMYI